MICDPIFMKRARHYREQTRTTGPEETNVSPVQKLGQYAGMNAGDVPGLSAEKRVAESSFTADANQSLGS